MVSIALAATTCQMIPSGERRVASQTADDDNVPQFPDGVLCPIHARMVSVQPIETKKPPAAPSEPVCLIQ
jgi:hypothetical protein